MKKKSIYKLAICCAIVGTALTSCGTLYKPYESAFKAPSIEAGDSLPHWRAVYTDPCLQALIDSTLARNCKLEDVKRSIKEAEIAYKVSKLAYLPTFAIGSPGSGIAGGISKLGSADAEWNYSLGVSAAWQWDIFGATITNNKLQKAALIDYQHDYLQAVECQLINSVAELYYQLLGEEKQLQIQQEMKVLYQKTYESTQSLFQAGQYTSAAVSEAKAQLENVETSIIDLQYAIENTKKGICRLMHEKPMEFKHGSLDDVLSTTGNLKGGLPEIVTNGVPANILRNRPDVRAAEKKIESAFYDIQISKGALYPSITITANGGWQNPTMWFANALGSLTQPIFQGGKLRANIKTAEIEQERVIEDFQDILLDSYYDVVYAMDDCKLAADKKEHLRAQTEAYQSSVEANQELMNNGSATYLEVLTSLMNLQTARTAEVTNKMNAAEGLVKLYGALGGR